MKMTRKSINRRLCSLWLALMIMATLPGNALAQEKNHDAFVDENAAIALATLFVQANVDTGLWNMDVQIHNVAPMLGHERCPAAYCVVFANHESSAGYVIVSTDLYDQLIVEYSPDSWYIVDSISGMGIDLDKLDQLIYYDGPLQYSLNEEIVAKNQEIEITEEMQKTRLHNEELIQSISPIALSLTSGYITYPLYFLQANFPGQTFSLSGSAETGYVLQYAYSETGADVVYATAAILKYYLGSSAWFSAVVNNCLSIAQSGGYAPNAASGNYSISAGNIRSFAQACINSLGIGQQASNCTSSWSNGMTEINGNRPFILRINSSTSYSNHTVVAFGWYKYVDTGSNSYNFYKVNDGYSTATSRYVYVNSCSSVMIKIV